MNTTGLMPMVTVNISLLAFRHVDYDLIYAVLVWTDYGQRHLRRLDPPVAVVAQAGGVAVAGLHACQPSAGAGWRSWLLASIPPSLRDVAPCQAADRLAGLLGQDPP